MLKPMIRVFVTGHTYGEVSEKAKLAIAEFFEEKEENIEKNFYKIRCRNEHRAEQYP